MKLSIVIKTILVHVSSAVIIVYSTNQYIFVWTNLRIQGEQQVLQLTSINGCIKMKIFIHKYQRNENLIFIDVLCWQLV